MLIIISGFMKAIKSSDNITKVMLSRSAQSLVRFYRYYYRGYFEMVGIIIGSLISFAFAFLLGTIAEKRGAKVMFWAIMGAVFGPFAIPFVFFTKTDIEKSKNS